MSTGRSILFLVCASLSLVLVACVPESDLERASGGRTGTADQPLTPIPEDELPEIRPLELRVLGVNLQRQAGQASVEISLGAGTDSRVEFAGFGSVEWSDGEVTDALPVAGGELRVETRRTDRSGDLVPVSLQLTNLTYLAGTDVHGEMTEEAIVTQWGTFLILDVQQVGRPPGWEVTYQAAGRRWISRIEVIHNGRHRPAEGTAGLFDSDFYPTTGTLRFGPEYDDFRDRLPLVARVDVRMAVPEVTIDLQ